MTTARKPLRTGGGLEGISLKRQSSHSPLRSRGSSCFSQNPIDSGIGTEAYHDGNDEGASLRY